jgi:glucokinase
MTKYFIGIDVGGTKIYGGLVTPSGEIVASHKSATPSGANVKTVTALIMKTVRALAVEAEVPLKRISGIGIGIPGIVDNDGRIIATPNLKLGNVDLKRILQKKLKIKVSIGNDVNLGVLGERWLGAGRKAENIVGIFPGTGVGGGIIVKNEFVAGAQGAAAEIGHMMIDPHGPRCSCGNIGCLEAHAGRWAIERDIRAALKRGERSKITQLAGKDFAQIKSSSLAKALKAQDRVVTRVMEGAAKALGQASVSLNHIFNPDMFLFGGGLIEACGDFLLPRVENALKKDPFFKRLKTPQVVSARLGDEAVMLGAVALAFRAAGIHSTGSAGYYPAIRWAGGKLSVKGKPVKRTCYIRADGKVREPDDFLPATLGPAELSDIIKKGPDLLVIAWGHGRRVVITPKGINILKKKKIALRILPIDQAIKAFSLFENRKALLFYL